MLLNLQCSFILPMLKISFLTEFFKLCKWKHVKFSFFNHLTSADNIFLNHLPLLLNLRLLLSQLLIILLQPPQRLQLKRFQLRRLIQTIISVQIILHRLVLIKNRHPSIRSLIKQWLPSSLSYPHRVMNAHRVFPQVLRVQIL